MSHPALPASDAVFAAALAESPRGPVRDGAFALWLVVRAALGAAAPAGPAPRHQERLKAVAARLRSLNAAGPLRRSLAAAIGDLQRGTAAAVVLSHLVAPAAETLGRRLAEGVAAAARAARGPKAA